MTIGHPIPSIEGPATFSSGESPDDLRSFTSAHQPTAGAHVVIGLSVFGFAFAVISSLHSYLMLAYAGSKKAAEDVGFYYAANAGGRLFGIVLSGVLTQAGGLTACLWGSAVMLALCLALVFLLPTESTMQHEAVAAAE